MKNIARLLPVIAALLAVAPFSGNAQSTPDSSKLELPATDDSMPGSGPVRRYDWFRKLWIEKRTAFARNLDKDQGALVFLGDSITQGWNDNFRGLFPGAKVANRGISGDTTRGVLYRIQEDVLAVHPSGVVLLIGTNDLEEHADPETIAGNLKLILAKLKEQNPKMPIILCQVFPSAESKTRPANLIKKVNELYAAAVRGDAQITLIETWPLFANEKGDAKPEEFPDLLHPNDAGYAKWAGALRPVLELDGLLPVAPDNFSSEPGFTSLFNGHDLTGWGFRQTPEGDIQSAKRWQASDRNAPPWPIVKENVSFDGQTASPDGRYVAKNDRLVVATPSEGRRIQKLSTTREFPKDFVLKLEFRATPNADSGIFIRDPQLQCRDYLIAGPYKQLKNYKALDWNEVVISVTNNVAYCTCNGEVLESAFKLPATGPIGLEGDRGQMEYRRIRFQELP